VQAWKKDYPWLQLAFRHIGPAGKAASDGWRARIEDDLQTTLDYRVKADGTASVWCGMSGYDFHHEPTPKELLEGLADAYRREVKRLGRSYPTRTSAWDTGSAPTTGAALTLGASGPVTVATANGPVDLPRAACDLLLDEIRRRGDADSVIGVFEEAGSGRPVSLDRAARIVVFDALWAMAESAGGYDQIDPQLRKLRDILKEEIAAAPRSPFDSPNA
jgi:hypothetical protein